MFKQDRRAHTIDFLFPVALFFLFALSSIIVILLAANIYRSNADRSARTYTTETALSYISEKIRQSDDHGSVSIGTFDSQDALVIEHRVGTDVYATYIYAYDGSLCELFIKKGTSATAVNGTKILEVRDFTMDELKPGLFSFSCTDKAGNGSSIVVGVTSRPLSDADREVEHE